MAPAARFWQAVWLVQIGLGAIVAMVTHAEKLFEFVGIVLATVTILQLSLVGMTTLLAWRADRSAYPNWRPNFTVRSLLVPVHETLAFGWLQWRMACATVRRQLPVANAVPCDRPVLLVHGLLCNHAVWRVFERRLLAAGYGPVQTVDLAPSLAPLAIQTVQLGRAIAAFRDACAPYPIAIVAHSMGGVVARAALGDMAASGNGPGVGALVTIATPHRGSVLARALPGAAPRDLRPSSAWLATMADARPLERVALLAIYGPDDNLVAPRANARWAHAREVAVPGVGHFGQLVWRQTFRQVDAMLCAASAIEASALLGDAR